MTSKLIFVGFWTWAILLAVHFILEGVWIYRNDLREPEPCGKWYCPQTWLAWLRNL
jgi:hypothetical protein